jgi:hypothetical protein
MDGSDILDARAIMNHIMHLPEKMALETGFFLSCSQPVGFSDK